MSGEKSDQQYMYYAVIYVVGLTAVLKYLWQTCVITLTHTSTLEIQCDFDFVYKTKRYDEKIPIYYVRNFSGTDDNCMNRLMQSRL